MQRDTYCPRRIRDTYTGDLWRFNPCDRRYHLRRGDVGMPPSFFYNQQGSLGAYYEEVRDAA